MWNKISLRLRLTLLVGTILTGICVILTTISVYNAERNFSVPIAYINYELDTAETMYVSSGVSELEVDQDGELHKTEPAVSGVDQDGEVHEAVPGVRAVQATRLFEASKTGFAKESLAYMVAIILGGAFLVWHVAGSALKPVTALSKTKVVNLKLLDSK